MRITMIAIKRTSFCLLLALILSVVAHAQRANITYINTRGAEKVAKSALISEWTYRDIKFKGKTKRTIPTDSLISVSYKNQPEIFSAAMDMIAEGNYRSAMPLLDDIIAGKTMDGKKLRKKEQWCQEPSLYQAWRLSRFLGLMKDADGYKAALLKMAPKTHFLPKVILREAQDFYDFGQFDKAIAAFAALDAKASKLGFGNEYRLLAGIGTAKALLGAGKISEAANAQAAVSTKAKGESQRLQCEVLRGDILLAQKKVGAAESLFQELFKKANYETQSLLFAGAANGLGDCAFAAGKFKDAMYEYSKTFALFDGQEGMDEVVGWAFWRFARCCKQLAAEIDTDEAKVLKYRFRKNRDVAAIQYRFSRGGQLARQDKGLGH